MRKIGNVTVLSCVAALAFACVSRADADPSRRRLSQALDRIVQRSELAHATWAVQVRSASSGSVLYERNEDKGMRPASTMKLVTTAAALDAFGPDARLLTTVESAARLDGSGRLLGDVWLVGRGDPSLSLRFDDSGPDTALEALADALWSSGVRRIEGRLVGHEGAFAGDRHGPDWMLDDLAWGYGAPVSALTYQDNVIRVTLTPGERVGDPVVLDVAPRTSERLVRSSVSTAAAGAERDIILDKPLGTPGVALSGTLPRGEDWEGEVAVDDPARFAAEALARVLEARGIVVVGEVATSSDPLPEDARTLAAHEGERLARLIQEVNKESQNLHAELLLRRLGLHRFAEGSVEKGREAVAAFVEAQGVPMAGWGLKDGSGLSHTNILTARGLVSLLLAMDRHTHRDAFRESLAVAGRDGTLEERMVGTPAEGRVLGKTGGLQSVSALAGYVTTIDGDSLVFAAFINDHVDLWPESLAALDDLAVALATAR